jgi:hypothetical protein
MRVAVVGSRGYSDLDEVRGYVRSLPDGTIIVSGGAHGVDAAAEEAAGQRGHVVESYRPDYAKHGGLLAKGANVFFIGRADTRTEQRTGLRISEVVPFAQAARRLCQTVVIKLENGKVDAALFQRLRGVLEAHRGGCEIVLQLETRDGRGARIRVGRELFVAYSAELRREIDDLLGPGRVQLIARTPQLEENGRNGWRGGGQERRPQ